MWGSLCINNAFTLLSHNLKFYFLSKFWGQHHTGSSCPRLLISSPSKHYGTPVFAWEDTELWHSSVSKISSGNNLQIRLIQWKQKAWSNFMIFYVNNNKDEERGIPMWPCKHMLISMAGIERVFYRKLLLQKMLFTSLLSYFNLFSLILPEVFVQTRIASLQP